jgi:hypothetical protein
MRVAENSNIRGFGDKEVDRRMGKIGKPAWNFEDLTGKKFGRLTVKKTAPKKKSNTTRWLCVCDCGNYTETTRTSLIKGHSKSCGCLATELFIKRSRKTNKYDLSNTFGIGYTSNTNNLFIFDLEDYEKIKNYCWYETTNNYIETRTNRKRIALHTLVLNVKNSDEIDHINREKNDNRKGNLRLVTRQQNCMNKSIQSNNKSGITGIYWDKQREKWVGSLTYKGNKYQKRFNTKNKAIKYRKSLEEKYFKEYAPDSINIVTPAEVERIKEQWGR